MHRFRVAAATQILRAHAEGQTGDRDAPLDAASEFKELRTVDDREHPDDGSLLRGGGDPRPIWTEGQRGQRTVMGRYHDF